MENKAKVAILVDGGLFIKRYKNVFGQKDDSGIVIAQNLYQMCLAHLGEQDTLYRIFYYDAKPFLEKVNHPITNRNIDFSKTDVDKQRLEMFEELKRSRKVALRLGYLTARSHGKWEILPKATKALLSGKMTLAELQEDDVSYKLVQKSVDMKIGVDISSLAYKQLVDKIILISGDGDFVPAAKVARREGIDFVLNPMGNPIQPELFEHIDGLVSIPPPYSKKGQTL